MQISWEMKDIYEYWEWWRIKWPGYEWHKKGFVVSDTHSIGHRQWHGSVPTSTTRRISGALWEHLDKFCSWPKSKHQKGQIHQVWGVVIGIYVGTSLWMRANSTAGKACKIGPDHCQRHWSPELGVTPQLAIHCGGFSRARVQIRLWCK